MKSKVTHYHWPVLGPKQDSRQCDVPPLLCNDQHDTTHHVVRSVATGSGFNTFSMSRHSRLYSILCELWFVTTWMKSSIEAGGFHFRFGLDKRNGPWVPGLGFLRK